jgi:hypothetical protein
MEVRWMRAMSLKGRPAAMRSQKTSRCSTGRRGGGGFDLAAEVAAGGFEGGGEGGGGDRVAEGFAAFGQGGVEGAVGLLAPGLVDDEVVGDAEEPPEEILLAEDVHVLDGPDPGFLEPFVGLAGVGGEAGEEGEERALVFFDQLAEGFGVAAPVGCQKLGIAAFH